MKEPTRKVTVRMPESLHSRLSDYAHHDLRSRDQLVTEAVRRLLAELAARHPTTEVPS